MSGYHQYTLPEPEAARWRKCSTRCGTDAASASQAVADEKARGKPEMLGVVYPALPVRSRGV